MDASSATVQLAEQIAERLRAEEALQRYASRLEHLHRISLAILSADSLAAVVQSPSATSKKQPPAWPPASASMTRTATK